MKSSVLGKSGLEVSEIGVGCWAIGGPDWNLNMSMGWEGVDDEQSLKGLQRAFELGATYFDTADVYGHGRSERIIGQFLKSVPRDQIILGTKVGYFSGCAPNAYHPVHLRHQLEMSLSNLGTDYIDIYYFHNLFFGDNEIYLDDAIELMRRFQQEGKVRFIGQRGPHQYSPHRLHGHHQAEDKYSRFVRLAAIIEPSILQIRFNMITPSFDVPEKDIFQWAKDHNVGVVMNKPLGQGLLLDKHDPNSPPAFGAGDHRARKRWFTPDALRILQKRLSVIKDRFGDSTEQLVRVAMQYCLYKCPNACVVVGFKTPTQIEVNMSASGQPLSEDDIKFIQNTMKGINEEIGSFFSKEVKDG